MASAISSRSRGDSRRTTSNAFVKELCHRPNVRYVHRSIQSKIELCTR
jgi:hypothetical protein